eukprot:5770537-Pyramimonas_sp.AAC.1
MRRAQKFDGIGGLAARVSRGHRTRARVARSARGRGHAASRVISSLRAGPRPPPARRSAPPSAPRASRGQTSNSQQMQGRLEWPGDGALEGPGAGQGRGGAEAPSREAA